jgi:TetR/AcrR family transcriptional regulator, lmrAB and yxaGH operons repressor
MEGDVHPHDFCLALRDGVNRHTGQPVNIRGGNALHKLRRRIAKALVPYQASDQALRQFLILFDRDYVIWDIDIDDRHYLAPFMDYDSHLNYDDHHKLFYDGHHSQGGRVSSEARVQMIEGAAMLLARHGVQATSFGEVLKVTGAPRGSIYHHFPRGKDQLIEEALDLLAAKAFDPMDKHVGESAERITQEFVNLWRTYLSKSKQQAGCAILAVTVTADSKDLVAHAAAVFRKWRIRLTTLLEQGGLPSRSATGFAAALIAAVEGATVFSRAERSLEPFDLVCGQMLEMVRRIAADSE